MRRILIASLAGVGGILIMVAAMLAIDMSVTDEDRAALQQRASASLDAIEGNRDTRGARKLSNVVSTVRDLDKGILHDFELDLAVALPEAPEGWSVRRYQPEDSDYIRKVRIERPMWDKDPINGTLNGAMHRIVTYEKGARKIVLQLSAKRKDIRAVQENSFGERAVDLMKDAPLKLQGGATPFATYKGTTFMELPNWQPNPYYGGSEVGKKRKTLPVGHRRIAFQLGTIIDGFIESNASDRDLINVISQIDIDALQTGLPRPTSAYDPEAEFTFLLRDDPLREPVPFTQAFKAYAMVRLAADKSAPDIDVLRYISRAEGVTWEDVRATWPDIDASERLLAVLGPLPVSQ